MLDYEYRHWGRGIERIAGVDEAGRGPLAGPVIAAAVIFNQSYVISEIDGLYRGLIDSKQLSESRRDHFFDILIQSTDVATATGESDAGEIDQINILKATHRAMARAVTNLPSPPDFILVDGLPVSGLPCQSESIVKGDALSLSIAASSVIAKVTRDRLMREMDSLYPEYGFAQHKGYGTKAHMTALKKYGPCPIHRMSFEPVRIAAGKGQQEMGFGE